MISCMITSNQQGSTLNLLTVILRAGGVEGNLRKVPPGYKERAARSQGLAVRPFPLGSRLERLASPPKDLAVRPAARESSLLTRPSR